MYRTDIINAEERLVIEVPEQLTKSKRRKNAYHCVFAEACNQLPNVEEAIVHLSTAYIRFKGEKMFRRYRVGRRLRDQIIIFDRYGDFDAGEYTLSLIQPSHQATGRRQGTEGNGQPQPRRLNRKKILIEGVRSRAKIASL